MHHTSKLSINFFLKHLGWMNLAISVVIWKSWKSVFMSLWNMLWVNAVRTYDDQGCHRDQMIGCSRDVRRNSTLKHIGITLTGLSRLSSERPTVNSSSEEFCRPYIVSKTIWTEPGMESSERHQSLTWESLGDWFFSVSYKAGTSKNFSWKYLSETICQSTASLTLESKILKQRKKNFYKFYKKCWEPCLNHCIFMKLFLWKGKPTTGTKKWNKHCKIKKISS